MALSDWLSVAGLVVGIAGFALTIRVVLQAKSAAEAARDAVLDTRSEITRNLLIALAPGLQRIEQSLEQAVKAKDRSRIVDGLVDWRWRANELLALIRSQGDDHGDLTARLQKSVALAVTAKQAIATKQTVSLLRTTDSFLTEVGGLISEIQVFTSELIPVTREARP